MEPTATSAEQAQGVPAPRRAQPGYRIAVVGATGAVGTMVLRVLGERQFPVAELVPFASARSAGRRVVYQDAEVECVTLDAERVEDFDVVVLSAGSAVSAEWAPRFKDAGAVVIDKSSAFRRIPGIPLVVAGVNDDDITADARIIASPNCSTMQMVVALKPILAAVGLERIVVSTYQSVSGTGAHAVAELKEQTAAMLHGELRGEPSVYPHQIAFNVLPQVESFADNSGYTTEEQKMVEETRWILHSSAEELRISATCVRVPVINCHSESINIQTRDELSPEECREILSRTPGIRVLDDPSNQIYPLPSEAANRDDVFVGRIRRDPSAERCLNLWVVSDNLRKGAATNAVQIAEVLHGRGLIHA